MPCIIDARASVDSSLPSFAPAQLHPVIWSGAAAHWTAHQYRVAVREAAEGLTVYWKTKLERNDVDDTVFWQQTLSAGAPASGKPKLTWPGSADDKTAKSMRGGLEPLAKALHGLATGLNLTVRNVTTHARDELIEQQAMERLAAYSFLAHLLDRAPSDPATAATAPAPGAKMALRPRRAHSNDLNQRAPRR